MSNPYQAQDVREVPDDALSIALKRIEQLESALKASTATGDQIPHLAGPTHDLLLADGSFVEHTGAIPTHVSFPDRAPVPVLAATAR